MKIKKKKKLNKKKQKQKKKKQKKEEYLEKEENNNSKTNNNQSNSKNNNQKTSNNNQNNIQNNNPTNNQNNNASKENTPPPPPTYTCPLDYALNGTECISTQAVNYICTDGRAEFSDGNIGGCVNLNEGYYIEEGQCPAGYGEIKVISLFIQIQLYRNFHLFFYILQQSYQYQHP